MANNKEGRLKKKQRTTSDDGYSDDYRNLRPNVERNEKRNRSSGLSTAFRKLIKKKEIQKNSIYCRGQIYSRKVMHCIITYQELMMFKTILFVFWDKEKTLIVGMLSFH